MEAKKKPRQRRGFFSYGSPNERSYEHVLKRISADSKRVLLRKCMFLPCFSVMLFGRLQNGVSIPKWWRLKLTPPC